jgi:hypothetical protein
MTTLLVRLDRQEAECLTKRSAGALARWLAQDRAEGDFGENCADTRPARFVGGFYRRYENEDAIRCIDKSCDLKYNIMEIDRWKNV